LAVSGQKVERWVLFHIRSTPIHTVREDFDGGEYGKWQVDGSARLIKEEGTWRLGVQQLEVSSAKGHAHIKHQAPGNKSMPSPQDGATLQNGRTKNVSAAVKPLKTKNAGRPARIYPAGWRSVAVRGPQRLVQKT